MPVRSGPPVAVGWCAGLWADRVVQSSYAAQAREHELSSEGELASIAAAWQNWARQPDGFFVVPHGEVLARAV